MSFRSVEMQKKYLSNIAITTRITKRCEIELGIEADMINVKMSNGLYMKFGKSCNYSMKSH